MADRDYFEELRPQIEALSNWQPAFEAVASLRNGDELQQAMIERLAQAFNQDAVSAFGDSDMPDDQRDSRLSSLDDQLAELALRTAHIGSGVFSEHQREGKDVFDNGEQNTAFQADMADAMRRIQGLPLVQDDPLRYTLYDELIRRTTERGIDPGFATHYALARMHHPNSALFDEAVALSHASIFYLGAPRQQAEISTAWQFLKDNATRLGPIVPITLLEEAYDSIRRDGGRYVEHLADAMRHHSVDAAVIEEFKTACSITAPTPPPPASPADPALQAQLEGLARRIAQGTDNRLSINEAQVLARLQAVHAALTANPPMVEPNMMGKLIRQKPHTATPKEIVGLAQEAVKTEIEDFALYRDARAAEDAMLGALRLGTTLSATLEQPAGTLPDYAQFADRGGLGADEGARDGTRAMLKAYIELKEKGYDAIINQVTDKAAFKAQLAEVTEHIITTAEGANISERHLLKQMNLLLQKYAAHCKKQGGGCTEFPRFAHANYPATEPATRRIKDALAEKYGFAKEAASKTSESFKETLDEHGGKIAAGTAAAGAAALIGGLVLARGEAEEDRRDAAQAQANGQRPPAQGGITFSKCMVALGGVTLLAAIGIGIRHMLQGGQGRGI